MSINPIQDQFKKIESTDLKREILSASGGIFEKVNSLGRFLRWIKGIFTPGDAFADCRAQKVAEEIASFVNNNRASLTEIQVKTLKDKVSVLIKKKKNAAPIEMQEALDRINIVYNAKKHAATPVHTLDKGTAVVQSLAKKVTPSPQEAKIDSKESETIVLKNFEDTFKPHPRDSYDKIQRYNENVGDLKSLGGKIGFSELKKLLGITTDPDKPLLFKTLCAIGNALKFQQNNIFKEEKGSGGKSETHAYALQGENIYIIFHTAKGVPSSDAIRLNDVSVPYIMQRIDEEDRGGEKIQVGLKFGWEDKTALGGKAELGIKPRDDAHELYKILKDPETTSSHIEQFRPPLVAGSTYLDFSPKTERMDLKQSSSDHLLNALIDAAKGLEHLHQKEFVHTNLEPGALVFEKSPGDKAFKGKIRNIGWVRKAGKPMKVFRPTYNSPGGNKASRKKDNFSFGITIFELATGSLPKVFDGDGKQKIDGKGNPLVRVFAELKQEDIDKILNDAKETHQQDPLKRGMLNVAHQLLRIRTESKRGKPTRISIEEALTQLQKLKA